MCPGESDGDVATQRPLSLWRAVLAAIDAAPQPAEGAGCSGSPEGRCASLWDGPAAHPSPAPFQPEEAGCAGATRGVAERYAAGHDRLGGSGHEPGLVDGGESAATYGDQGPRSPGPRGS